MNVGPLSSFDLQQQRNLEMNVDQAQYSKIKSPLLILWYARYAIVPSMLQAFTVCHVLSEQKHHPPSLHVDKALTADGEGFPAQDCQGCHVSLPKVDNYG